MAETKKIAIVVSEGTFDKGMMSMMIANTAASMGMEVHIFHTFFGLNLLKKAKSPKLPGMFRFFTGTFVKKMKKIGVDNYSEQMKLAMELGVNIYACNTTLELLGVKKEDMYDGVKILGAAGFLDIAVDADSTMFIG
ncbi:MAG: DsrE/DsrF/DrsH-like family protein [Methanomassiliicoccales archaeon]|jgi:peroxiredoxin family protein